MDLQISTLSEVKSDKDKYIVVPLQMEYNKKWNKSTYF